MRSFISAIAPVSLALLLMAVAVAAQESTTPAGRAAVQQSPTVAQTNVAADGVRRITPAEVREALNQGQAVIVDVRSPETFAAGHIKGALSMPVAEFLSKVDQLPRDKMIVTYCSWPNEHSSAGAVLNLKTKGFENAAAVLGGYDAMVKAGFAVETNATQAAPVVQQGPNAPAPGVNNPNDTAVVNETKATAQQNSNQATTQNSRQAAPTSRKRKRHKRSTRHG